MHARSTARFTPQHAPLHSTLRSCTRTLYSAYLPHRALHLALQRAAPSLGRRQPCPEALRQLVGRAHLAVEARDCARM